MTGPLAEYIDVKAQASFLMNLGAALVYQRDQFYRQRGAPNYERAFTDLEKLAEDFEFICNGCGSPIEQLLAAELLFDWGEGIVIRYGIGQNHREVELPSQWDDSFFQLFEQEKLGNYRVDFLIAFFCPTAQYRLVIECDGHDFHSTKEDRERDAKRDRWMTRHHCQVMRFTGSEIYRNPRACRDEILDFLKLIINNALMHQPNDTRSVTDGSECRQIEATVGPDQSLIPSPEG